MVLQQTWSP